MGGRISLKVDQAKRISGHSAIVAAKSRVVCMCCAMIVFCLGQFGGQTAQGQDPHTRSVSQIDFDRDVMPIFSRYGCNAAQCHGASNGQKGFKLSLFSGDPQSDFEMIALESKGRRIFRTTPAQSLILRKATGDLQHDGGKLFHKGSDAYDVLTAWIAQGAERHSVDKLVRIDTLLTKSNMLRVGDTFDVSVAATFRNTITGESDERVVTAWSILEPFDESAIQVGDSPHRFQVLRAGSHFLLVRFLTEVRLIQIDVPFNASSKHAERENWGEFNWIDEVVNDRWQLIGLAPPSLADDATLVRRLHLTLIGRLPEPSVVRQYLEEVHPQRFERLLDSLLNSAEFVDLWTAHFADWFRIGSETPAETAPHAVAWIRRQIELNRPLDEFASEIITAKGVTGRPSAAALYANSSDPRLHAERFAQAWMGVRLRCAECHNHPLDRWKQDDYYSLAAVFAGTSFGQSIEPKSSGSITNPRTGLPATPSIDGLTLFGGSDDVRRSLANWLVAAENPYFGRAIVNRVVALLMGRAFCEPVDDLRQSNPTIDAELFDRLTESFRENGFQLRPLIREIVTSAAWRRESVLDPHQVAAGIVSFRSHKLAPTVLLDAICDLTGTPLVMRDRTSPAESRGRAIQLPLPHLSAEINALGACARESADVLTQRDTSLDLAQALQLINGPWLNDRLMAPEGRLQHWFDEGLSDEEMLTEIYWRGYSRLIDPVEVSHWLDILKSTKSKEARALLWHDILWSIIMSQEFVTNH
ncbi:MAG TPA: DUF1549 domain-containing protein [Pirellulaceae bacterium]|nr:DUF1549 domain-containing protein [Pirellulaceae bacterium]HMO93358.1 DUF1549 domain-containing protein [Pirellulaceae bacterium]HMP70129.1 DUF1549 domain-containing protein [Pirellulaceae bacterium]